MNPTPGEDEQNQLGRQSFEGYPPPPPGYAQPGPSYPGARGQGFNLQDLVQRWWAVLTSRSVQSFDAQLPAANWPTVWISLSIYAAFGGVVRIIDTVVNPTKRSGNSTVSAGSPVTNVITTVLITFIAFLIEQAIFFAIARVVYKSAGTFLSQAYLLSLVVVPLGILTTLLTRISIVGGLLSLVSVVFELYLTILAIASAQRLPRNQAAFVVLIPIMLALVLLVCIVLAGVVLAAANAKVV